MSHYFAPPLVNPCNLRVENLTIWPDSRPFWPISVQPRHSRAPTRESTPPRGRTAHHGENSPPSFSCVDTGTQRFAPSSINSLHRNHPRPARPGIHERTARPVGAPRGAEPGHDARLPRRRLLVLRHRRPLARAAPLRVRGGRHVPPRRVDRGGELVPPHARRPCHGLPDGPLRQASVRHHRLGAPRRRVDRRLLRGHLHAVPDARARQRARDRDILHQRDGAAGRRHPGSARGAARCRRGRCPGGSAR